GYFEHACYRQRDRFAVAQVEDVDALVEDNVAGARALQHLELHRLGHRQEHVDYAADRFFALGRFHRDVVIDGVVGEEAEQFIDVLARPCVTEFGHNFFSVGCHCEFSLFVVEIKAVLVLVIAEQLGETPPVHHRDELALRLFARQQHREVFEHDFLGKRLVLLAMEQADEVAEETVLLQLLAHDEFALVDLRLEKLFAQRLEHRVASRSRNQAEDFRGLHDLEQIAEFEIEIARDFVAVLAPAAILEQFEQAKHQRQPAVGQRSYDRRRHQPRSSIIENTLSVSALKASVRRSRGLGSSTLRSLTTRPGPAAITIMRSASSMASSMM